MHRLRTSSKRKPLLDMHRPRTSGRRKPPTFKMQQQKQKTNSIQQWHAWYEKLKTLPENTGNVFPNQCRTNPVLQKYRKIDNHVTINTLHIVYKTNIISSKTTGDDGCRPRLAHHVTSLIPIDSIIPITHYVQSWPGSSLPCHGTYSYPQTPEIPFLGSFIMKRTVDGLPCFSPPLFSASTLAPFTPSPLVFPLPHFHVLSRNSCILEKRKRESNRCCSKRAPEH